MDWLGPLLADVFSMQEIAKVLIWTAISSLVGFLWTLLFTKVGW